MQYKGPNFRSWDVRFWGSVTKAASRKSYISHQIFNFQMFSNLEIEYLH